MSKYENAVMCANLGWYGASTNTQIVRYMQLGMRFLVNIVGGEPQKNYVICRDEKDAEILAKRDSDWHRIDKEAGYQGPSEYPVFLLSDAARWDKYQVLQLTFPGLVRLDANGEPTKT